MKLNIKIVSVIAILAVAIAAGVFMAGKNTDSSQSSGNSPQSDGLSGKLAEDPNARFNHFGVGNSNVKSIYTDGSIAWIGTSSGVIRYNTATDDFRIFNNENALLSNGIFHVGKLDDKIVVGTYGGGMSVYDDRKDSWKHYNVPDGLGDAFIYKTLKASNGDIWIATWSGANRVVGGALDDRSKWEIYTVENTKGGLPNDWVYSLSEGKDGEIWLATEGGLARYKDGQWLNWNHKTGVGAPEAKIKNEPKFGVDPSKFSEHHARQKVEMGLGDTGSAFNPNYIVSMAVDKEGIVWCGTWGGGLSRFDGKKWTHLTMSNGLPGNHVFTLHVDPNGILWVGTNNGLASLVNGKFNPVTEELGVSKTAVFSMTTAEDGSQWIGTFGGVTHISASQLNIRSAM